MSLILYPLVRHSKLTTACSATLFILGSQLNAADHTHASAPALPATQSVDGQSTFRLVELSAITRVAAGGSTGDAEQLEWSETGAHDPRRDGFDFQELELTVAGAVDPYFRAASHMVITEDGGLELEEVYAETTSLPHGLVVEVGLMLTEFGYYNPIHPHEYAHIDQPMVIGTMMGSEGTRDVGMRVGWLMPLAWYSHLDVSVQNGDNETAVSFLGEGHHHGEEAEEEHEEGRNISELNDVLWSARWKNGFAMSTNSEIQIGVSAAYGPNLDENHTILYGADVIMKWFQPEITGGGGTLTWINEYIGRQAGADDGTTSDWGLVSTLVYDIDARWLAGFRVDYVDVPGSNEVPDPGELEEELPEQRLRLSPLIGWRPSEFTKFRLQYNYTDGDGQDIHSVWLGIEVLIGMHPAHNF